MMIKKLVICLVSCLLFSSCYTVSPDNVRGNTPDPDYTTPTEFISEFNGGYLGRTEDSKLAVISSYARERYNAYIDKYKLQFKERYSITLSTDLGIQELPNGINKILIGNKFVLIDSNKLKYKLFTIDKTRLKYFIILNQWSNNNQPSDTAWQKIKDKIGL